MIVLDASVLIAQLESGDRHHVRAVKLLSRLADVLLLSSTITMAEVLVSYAHAARVDEGEGLLRRLEVTEVPLGAQAARRLAVLRATTRLKLPDCCVLLAAQDARADSIATFDDRLAEAARGLGLSVASA